MSSVEPIGIVAEIRGRREAAVARLSDAARHRAFPGIYAKPVPYESTLDKEQKARIVALEADKVKLNKEIAQLRQTIAELQKQLTTAATAAAIRITQRTQEPKDVINAFVDTLNAGRDEASKIELSDLAGPRRSRSYAAPRHVCIWLVRQLCTHMSLPRIGKLFGGRDHTTTMHADKRAPYWISIDPELKAAADAVLLRFGGVAP